MTSLWLERATPPGTDPFPAGGRADTVVVGAGLTGLVTAVMLARAGRDVAVLEARHIGAVTTGNTTGKISLLQGTHLSKLRTANSHQVASAYLAGNRAGMAWLLDFCAEQDVDVEFRSAVTYATDPATRRAVKREFHAGTTLGLGLKWRDSFAELPFPTYGGVRLHDQAQFDPIEALIALTAELRRLGGRVIEHTRVTGLGPGRPSLVHTAIGDLRANQVILASGVPFLDRGMYFAKTTPQRSYVAAYAVPGPVPTGMYLSGGSPSRSLRTAHHDGSDRLLVGGNGHIVGRNTSPTSELVDDLDQWTEQHFPGARRTHAWSAQDYSSINHIPFIGRFPGIQGNVWLATGYSKWGMTNAVMAGLMITAELQGDRPGWATTLQRRITNPPGLVAGLKANTATGWQAFAGWMKAELVQPGPGESVPADGDGLIVPRGALPAAVSTTAGRTCTVSAVCTHLGGVLRYNNQEKSWDCPLHGSRFATDGSVLEGPAIKPLPVFDN